MHKKVFGWLAGAAALLALSAAFLAPSAASASVLPAGIEAVCPASSTPGQMACSALINTNVASPGTGVQPADTAPSGLTPANLQDAYELQSSDAGFGQTVAVIDAYDDPNAEADLAVYRAQYGLPACTSASGCFTKVDENGGTDYPAANTAWAAEISLDLDMVSAICPNCRILLVEADSASITDLGTAVNTAVSMGARFVSNSYYGPEDSNNVTYDDTYFNHPGVAITAAAGDNGYGNVSYPAASQYVTAVGGTTLTYDSSLVRDWSESAWDQTASGCSAYDAKPAWQTDTGCTDRTVADVAAVADPATGVAAYDSYNEAGWLVEGGTSVSAAIVAATYALAGTPATTGYPASYPYSYPGKLTNITTGSNGTCSISYLCTAGTGYNGPTGLGTPAGDEAFSSTGTLTGEITSAEYGMCLDDKLSSTADKNPIDVYTCNGTDAQDWTVEPDGTLQVLGKCLDVDASGTADGTLIDLYTCNGTGAQQWIPKGDGTLVNPESDKCAEDPGGTADSAQLVLEPCDNADDEQLWTMPYSIPAATGTITAGFDSSLCVDDDASSTADKNPIDVYTCNGTAAQSWTVEPDGSIEVLGDCLDVDASGSANGTLVDLYTCNGSGAQQWRMLTSQTLVNPESGKCLDDPDASEIDKTQLQIWSCDGNPEQNWVFTPS
jgi:hypothetical protein